MLAVLSLLSRGPKGKRPFTLPRLLPPLLLLAEAAAEPVVVFTKG